MPEISRRRTFTYAAVVLVVVSLAGRVLMPAPHRPGAAVAAPQLDAASEAPAKVVVHVVGGRRAPGLYRLNEGSRVDDAITKAGGATRRASLAGVNLAALVADGQQIAVPVRTPPPGGAGSDPAAAHGGATGGGRVHLNSATLEQLDAPTGGGAGHGAEHHRLPHRKRSLRLRRRTRHRLRNRSRAPRAAEGARRPLIARVRLTAPHVVVAALCLGLAGTLALQVHSAGVLLLAAEARRRRSPHRSSAHHAPRALAPCPGMVVGERSPRPARRERARQARRARGSCAGGGDRAGPAERVRDPGARQDSSLRPPRPARAGASRASAGACAAAGRDPGSRRQPSRATAGRGARSIRRGDVSSA